MCGIAGLVNRSKGFEDGFSELSKMLEAISYRGPDDSGMWRDEAYGVALGHRRLSILDLSISGHQPMLSPSGRFVIVFNGEIYNHSEIRKLLENKAGVGKINWRGHSDTETLLAAFDSFGIEDTIQKCVGMFAFALWDNLKKDLYLVRDRLGEKPLYYGWQGNSFLFGSELKALRANSSFERLVDNRSAASYLRLNYVPGPASIYEGIYKLQPGSLVKLSIQNCLKRELPTPKIYWSIKDIAEREAFTGYTGSYHEAVDELESLVLNSVKQQSIADVPVGAFLSGGIDSSTVVAMMRSVSNSEIHTFSIGMPVARYDEAGYAEDVARYFGTAHSQYTISEKDAFDIIPNLQKIWDEPFADSSQIPTYLVNKIASEKVKVVLSGDGGDEFFLGYSQYSFYKKLWKLRHIGRRLPWNTLFKYAEKINSSAINNQVRRGKTLVAAWRQPNVQMLSRYWFDRYRQSDVPLMIQDEHDCLEMPLLNDVASTAALWDSATYLPDDILVKVDRASMANSIETRAPLLDHRIVEFSHRLPLEYKISSGVGKRVLRDVLYRHIPRERVDRPKMGFDIPLSNWLRNGLRPWVEEKLSELNRDPLIFNKSKVYKIWNEHVNKEVDRTDQVWAIVMLISFFDEV